MRKLLLPFLLLICINVFSQNIGTRVSFIAADGRTYFGSVKEIAGNNYKIKYEGVEFEAWLTRDQFTVTDASAGNATGVSTADARAVFNFGKSKGWTTGWQEEKLNIYLNKLTADQYKVLQQFLNTATTSSAKFFALKSLLGGDDWPTLWQFVNELNQYSEAYQQEHCLITTHKSIIQQWQVTCSVTVVQAFLGDICPRYTWDMKKVPDFDIEDPDPYKNPMGIQQKELIEKYGGVVSKRNDNSGKIIPINSVLNDYVGKILNKSFDHYQVTEPLPTVFAKVRNQLDKGIDTPLLVGFQGTGARHFLLALRYRNTNNGVEYLIYDPWDGVCDYVTESTLMRGSLSPLNTSWKISVDYYYLAN